MKKVIILMTMLILATGNAYSSGERFPVNGTKAEKTIWADTRARELTAKAEEFKNRSIALNEILQDLGDSLITNYLSPDVAKDVTGRLTKIYYTLDEKSSNPANKIRIIEIIGLSDNSPEAHDFFLKILENGPNKYREHALWSGRRIHGDDVYDKIKNLMARGVIDKAKFLYALKFANSQRALVEIQEFIKTTDDLEQFIKKGQLLCSYKDPDVMDVVIDRYDYFKSKPIPAEYAQEMYSADGAFDLKMMEIYIKAKEGERYKKALEVLSDMGVFGSRKIAWLESKLKSSDLTTRRASIDFLRHQIDIGSVKKENIQPILKDVVAMETNKELKNELNSMLKKIGK